MNNLTKSVPAFFLGTLIFLAAPSASAKYIYSDAALIDGFNRTVFGSEFSGLLAQSYVRKFTVPVRFYVRSDVGHEAKAKVHQFISKLTNLVQRLPAHLVLREQDANFIVHIVQRDKYADTIRQRIYKRVDAPVHGRCMVRSIYSRKGISRSEAVIVADEGEDLFNRCMTEEILQGLGPLNDDPILSNSMFNDTSKFTKLRLFDRYILNMLYDWRIKPGASKENANLRLPQILTHVRGRLEPEN